MALFNALEKKLMAKKRDRQFFLGVIELRQKLLLNLQQIFQLISAYARKNVFFFFFQSAIIGSTNFIYFPNNSCAKFSHH